MPAPGEKPCVFLCCAEEDLEEGEGLYQKLEEKGLKPWWAERDILPGEKKEFAIRRAMRLSHAVIVCLSGRSVGRPGYVQKQIKMAVAASEEQPEGAIFLIPARLDSCDIPQQLEDYQWVDLFRDGGHDKLLRSLQTHEAPLDLWLPEAQDEAPEPPSTLKRLAVEVSSGSRFEIDEVSVEMPVRLFRNRVLSAEGGRPEPARVLHLCNGRTAPLPLQKNLAQTNVRDGDRLFLSRLVDEEESPDDGGQLVGVLAGFYAHRMRQIKADAQRVGIDWTSVRALTGTALVKALLQQVAEKRGLLDLAILAIASDPNDVGLRTALARFGWYGSPGEVAPQGWSHLKSKKRAVLQTIWQTLAEENSQDSGNHSATRNPVSGS